MGKNRASRTNAAKASQRDEVMIGKTVGHYRITAKIGAGGMGEVFLAEDKRLERRAAIKFLPADLAEDPERRRRFLSRRRSTFRVRRDR